MVLISHTGGCPITRIVHILGCLSSRRNAVVPDGQTSIPVVGQALRGLGFWIDCRPAIQASRRLFVYDSKWFQMILDDSRCYYMILSDSDWFQMVLHASKSLHMPLDDSKGFEMVLDLQAGGWLAYVVLDGACKPIPRRSRQHPGGLGYRKIGEGRSPDG